MINKFWNDSVGKQRNVAPFIEDMRSCGRGQPVVTTCLVLQRVVSQLIWISHGGEVFYCFYFLLFYSYYSINMDLIFGYCFLWLLVNSFKETFKEKRHIDFFSYYFKIFWLFYYFFQHILIILLLFSFLWFNRGYSVNNRLDFALTVIKRHYNAND